MSKDRQTGRTTQQLKNAPQGAIFVWCNSHTYYPQNLARELGRSDIKIKPFSWLEERNVRGLRGAHVVIDHATWEVNRRMSDTTWHALGILRRDGALA